MKRPDMRAVTETARLATVVSSPSEPWIPGMTFSSVWANSQNVMTARTTPSSHPSPGGDVLSNGSAVRRTTVSSTRQAGVNLSWQEEAE